jgi:hypothetical protein
MTVFGLVPQWVRWVQFRGQHARSLFLELAGHTGLSHNRFALLVLDLVPRLVNQFIRE